MKMLFQKRVQPFCKAYLQVSSFLKDLLVFYISLSNKIHTIDDIFLCDIKLEKHYLDTS